MIGRITDALAGTTITLAVSDDLDNTNCKDAIRQSSFCAKVADDLYTGTIVDKEVAESFGTPTSRLSSTPSDSSRWTPV